jgi:hypothetical protein
MKGTIRRFGGMKGTIRSTPFAGFLEELVTLCVNVAAVRYFAPGELTLYRARRRKSVEEMHTTPEDLGPPRAVLSKQSNRMNPPGIPMFYGADTQELAIAETGAQYQSVGQFISDDPLIILDLANLPRRKGVYSIASRREVDAIGFLHDFAELIRAPVTRDEREHIDYVPTQVFTEFLRDFKCEIRPKIKNGVLCYVSGEDLGEDEDDQDTEYQDTLYFEYVKFDGIRYQSAITGVAGANIVLFATQNDVIDGAEDKDVRDPLLSLRQWRWLRLVKAEQVSTITIRAPR